MKKAIYGTREKNIDVIKQLESKKTISITNQEFGTDPCPGQVKYLQICMENKTKQYYLENTMVAIKELENPPKGDLFKDSNPFITFIIPTIGRESLKKAIQSLIDNESKLWKAIVVFDGISIITFPHPSIQSITIPKVGFRNCAGEVRNRGIKLADTEWIGFLDDDDTLTQDYMYRLQNEIQANPNADIIVFRMINSDHRVIPSRAHLAYGNVGISFVVKRKIFDFIKFEANTYEDFHLLNRAQQNNYKIHISNFITYLVR